jgi:hypothetical protein
MPNRKLRLSLPPAGTGRLAAAAVIGFSLTLVSVGLAILAGVVPSRLLPDARSVDATVLLLFVPLCALTFAILAEAVRTTVTGNAHQAARAPASRLDPWRPGRGEG